MTEYRDIEGFPGYRVGDDGTVWSAWARTAACRKDCRSITDTWHRLKERRQTRNSAVYVKVVLFRDGKRHQFFIHKLVLTTFRGPCPEGMESRHLDDVHDNNRLDNLKWGTRLENAADRRKNTGYNTNARGEAHGMHKLTVQQVSVRRRAADGESQKRIAASLGVCKSTVGYIVRGRTWQWLAA